MTDVGPAEEGRAVFVSAAGFPAPDDIGAKARGLLSIAEAGFLTPPWFVVRPAAMTEAGTLSQTSHREIEAAVRALGGSRSMRFAVRSSAADEDGHERSFAGQYGTALGVRAADIPSAIEECFASGRKASLDVYRRASRRPADVPAPRMAVIVQEFVEPRTAGIAFSREPVHGRDHVVIEAVRGRGDALARGAVRGDRIVVDREDRIVSTPAGDRPVLSRAQALQVAGAARLLEVQLGAPQDIEWAFTPDGALYVLQTRPITGTEPGLGSPGEIRVWDNANIVESFPDLTLPLTYSVALSLYADVYRATCLALGVPRATVAREAAVFAEMLGLHRGQVYYNLQNWYRVLAMLPGFRLNAGFLESMMGAGRPGSRPTEAPLETTGSAARRLEIATMTVRLIYRYLRFEVDARRFRRSVARLLSRHRPTPRRAATSEDLLRSFEAVRGAAVRQWATPIMNDLFLMIAHGSLRRLAARWLGAGADEAVTEWLVQGDVASAASGSQLLRIVEVIRSQPAWAQLVVSVSPEELAAWLEADGGDPSLVRLVRGYLDTWADRAPRELQLDRKRYAEDPIPLLRTLQAMVAPEGTAKPSVKEARGPAPINGRRIRRRDGGLRAAILRLLVRTTRRHIRWREEMRMARGQVFGVGRRIFQRLGKTLFEAEILERPDDIHYLTVDELARVVRGHGSTPDVRTLVARRRSLYVEYEHSPRLPSRFETIGGAEPPIPLVVDEHGAGSESTTWRGLGVSIGQARARCVVVQDPLADVVVPGRIVVARSMDPGWIPLLVGAAGLLAEQGSMLSHSAIVARELRIPMVVGLPGLVDALPNGSLLTIDGSTGDVRRVSDEEAVA